jgi:hypothetical protein
VGFGCKLKDASISTELSIHAPPVVEHQDLLRVLARAQAVGDDERRAVLAQPHERLLDACCVWVWLIDCVGTHAHGNHKSMNQYSTNYAPASVCESRAEVASSKSTMGGSLSKQRAMATLFL